MSRVNLPHVLIMITKGDVGGAQTHVLSLIDALGGQFRFTLACGEEEYLTRQGRKMGIEVRILSNLKRPISPWQDFKGYQEIKSLIAEIDPDLVHLHSSKAGVIGRLAARSNNIPSLFTAHGWAFTPGTGWLQRCYGLLVEWIMARVGDGIINVSRYDSQLSRRLGVVSGKGNWTVQNGVAPVTQQANPGDDVVPNLITIGRMVKQKNQKLLIEAISKIDQDLRLVIIGSGVLKPGLVDYASEMGLNDRVDFVEESGDIDGWYAESHLFVLGSNYEGLPLSVLEAMSAGLPVVSTDVGGVSEAVIDGTTGFLVEIGDSNMLADKISILVKSPEKREKMGVAGKSHYQDNFQLEKMCEATANIYSELLSGR